MTVIATVLLTLLAAVCLGIPLTAIAVVYRDELAPLRGAVRRALAFDPRHQGIDAHPGR